MMPAYVYLIEAGKDDDPMFQPRVTVGVQTFNFGYRGTREEAEGMARMFRIALVNAGANVDQTGLLPDWEVRDRG